MSRIVDTLERRVDAAVALIATLREQTASLERRLAAAQPDAPVADRRCDPDELERLRAERVVVRDRIRALIREIDRVSW